MTRTPASAFVVTPSVQKIFGLLALSALSLFTYGYVYGLSSANLNQLLPFISKIGDPALFPADPYVRTLACYPSLYPRLMAWLGLIAPLAPLHLLIFLALKYWLLDVVYDLSEHLFRERATTWLACLLFALSPLVNARTLLGDDPLMKPLLYQTSLAGPAALLAVSLFIRGRHVASFAALALLYYVNGMVANFVLVLFAFASPRAPRSVWKGWGAFLLLWLPWLVWYLRMPDLNGGPSADFLPLLKAWYPGHYFPSCWNLRKWTNAVLYSALFLFFIRDGLKRSRDAGVIKPFLWGFAAMWTTAVVAGELLPCPRVVILQLLRSDVFFISLGLLFAADHLQRRLASGTLKDWASAGLLLLLLVQVTTAVRSAPLLLLFGASVLPYELPADVCAVGVLLLATIPVSSAGLAAYVALTAAGLLLLAWRGGRLRRWIDGAVPYLFGAYLFAPELAGATAAPVLLTLRSRGFLEKLALVGLLALFSINLRPTALLTDNLALAVFFVGLLFVARPQDRAPAWLGTRRMSVLLLLLILLPFPRIVRRRLETGSFATEAAARPDDYEDVQRWAKAHTAVDSVFITPPYYQGFRSFSERSTFVEWTDGAAMHWSPGFEREWSARLGKVGFSDREDIPSLRPPLAPGEGPSERTRSLYAGLDARRLALLAREYPVRYVVREEGRPLPLTLVYRNKSFLVYRLSRSAP